MGFEKVFNFINTALDWVTELSGQFLEERIEESRTTFIEVEKLLIDIGATGKFNKNLNKKDDIWTYAMTIAVILNGQDVEGTEFKNINDYFDNLKDLSSRWKDTKLLTEALRNDADNKKYFSTELDLSTECEIFYDNILRLRNWKAGFFSTKKLKRRISGCSEKLFSVCHGYVISIDFRKGAQKLECILKDDD